MATTAPAKQSLKIECTATTPTGALLTPHVIWQHGFQSSCYQLLKILQALRLRALQPRETAIGFEVFCHLSGLCGLHLIACAYVL